MNYFIGIDPGTHTGFAVWDGKKFMELSTYEIWRAFERVEEYRKICAVEIVMEDARLRKWYGTRSDAKMQGAGSIKRDCAIWEEFCEGKGIPLRKVAPLKGGTKWDAESFAKIIGWKGRTSNHARDAALLVFGLS